MTTALPEPPPDWLTVEDMSRKLRIGKDWIDKRLADRRYDTISMKIRGLQHNFYPPECLEDLLPQVTAHRAFPKKGQALSLQEAADQLGVSLGAIESLCVRHDIPVVSRRSSNNRIVKCLTRLDVRNLGSLLPPIAPSNWHNVHQLSHLTGWSYDTVRNRLAKSDLERQFYRASSGHPALYYPPEAVSIVGFRADAPPPGGDWLTATRLADLIDRDYHWVKLRIGQFEQVTRKLQDDSGAIKRHYPPWVRQRLAHISQQIDETAAWKTVNAITMIIGRSPKWIRSRLKPFAAEAKVLKTNHATPQPHYPPWVVQKLIDMSHRQRQSGRRTDNDIAA